MRPGAALRAGARRSGQTEKVEGDFGSHLLTLTTFDAMARLEQARTGAARGPASVRSAHLAVDHVHCLAGLGIAS